MVVEQRVSAPAATVDSKPAVAVSLFEAAAGLAGARAYSLPADESLTVREAFLRLCHVFPDLRRMEGHLLFAANADYAGDQFVLGAGDTLCLISPFSGGATP